MSRSTPGILKTNGGMVVCSPEKAQILKPEKPRFGCPDLCNLEQLF